MILSALIGLFGLVPGAWAAAEKNAKIVKMAAIGISGQQREALLSIAYAFQQQNPDLYVRYIFKEDSVLKQEISDWMNGESEIDLILWQAGERLFRFVRKDKVLPIDQFWQQQKLDEKFPASVKTLVAFGGRTYGLPVSYYNWGFYYKPVLFKRLGIKPPANWSEFRAALQTLQLAGITPIAIGTKERWPVSAWFEYLNLRINGLDFHRKVLSGEQSFQDERIRNVLVHWQGLIEQGYFFDKHNELTWRDTLPDLLRENAGVVLMGNFMTQLIPLRLRGQIDVFGFPEIDNSVGRFELSPTDVLVIPKTAKRPDLAQKFMAFLLRTEQQDRFNQGLSQFSLSLDHAVESDPLHKKGHKLLVEADGLTQYFDRDASEAYARALMPIWVEFLSKADVTDTMQKMEQARKEFHKPR